MTSTNYQHQGASVTTLICARCKAEVREEDAKIDSANRAYHVMCYQIAYPESPKNGLVITGVDIPFVDLTVLVFKLTMASLLVGLVFGFVWMVFRLVWAR
jgi:hypothetical protein